MISMILILAGAGCLGISGLVFYKLKPRDGEPPSPWVGSEGRGTLVALGLLVLILAGISMLLKGVVS